MQKLLTTKQAAEYLGYSEPTLRKSRVKGYSLGGAKPPKHVKIGRATVRYRLSDLDEWVKGLG